MGRRGVVAYTRRPCLTGASPISTRSGGPAWSMSRPRSRATGGPSPGAGSTWSPRPPRRSRGRDHQGRRAGGGPGGRHPGGQADRRPAPALPSAAGRRGAESTSGIEDNYVEVEAQVETVDRTGVEMEALTAAAVAALTIYDMCKSVDRSMTIGDADPVGEDRRPFGVVSSGPNRRPRPLRPRIPDPRMPDPRMPDPWTHQGL